MYSLSDLSAPAPASLAKLRRTTLRLPDLRRAPMDKRLKKMEKKLLRARKAQPPKQQRRARAERKAQQAEDRKRAKEYLQGDGADWASKLHEGAARFAAPEDGQGAAAPPTGLTTADELREQRERQSREEVESRAAAARARVHSVWAEAEAKREAEALQRQEKRESKKKRKAERAAQQRSLSFSLDDDDEGS